MRAVPSQVHNIGLTITGLPTWYPNVPYLDIMFSLVGWDVYAAALFERSRRELRSMVVHLDVNWYERGWMEDRMMEVLLRAFRPHFDSIEGTIFS